MDEKTTCDVVMLVPQVSGQSLLGRSAIDDGSLSLPTRQLEVGADTERVVAEVRKVVGADPRVLRICTMAWNAEFDATVVVVETEPFTGPPPDGHCWVSVHAHGRPAVEPVTAQPVVDSWLRERDNGPSGRRAPWSRPGWWDDAVGWALGAAGDAGLRAAGAPELVKMWGISVVLRLPLEGGEDAYFKSSCPAFGAEAAVTEALAGWAPSTLPEVIAADAAQARLLMRDLGGIALEGLPGSWTTALETAADLQRSSTVHVDTLLALGAQHRPLARLAETASTLEQHDDLMSRLPDATRLRWSAAAQRVVDACLLLDELGPAPTLVHGDLHPGNMVVAHGAVKIFDWTDAAITHPFIDLVTFVRSAPSDDRDRLCEAYLRRWTDAMTPESLARAAQLALPVGAFYQVWTYLLLLPTLLPEDHAQLANADVRWMDRCLTLLDEMQATR